MKRAEFLKEIRGLSLEDAKLRARALAEESMKLRFRSASGQLEHGHRLGQTRRNVARVLTEVRRMQMAAKGKA